MKKLSITTLILFVLVTAFLCVGCQANLLQIEASGLKTNTLSQYESGICSSGVTEYQADAEDPIYEEPILVEEDSDEPNQNIEAQIRDTRDYTELKGELKKMLVKITGENSIEELGDRIVKDGVYYFDLPHTPNIDLDELGYRPLFIDEVPEYDPATQATQRYYYDDGELIHRAWRIVELDTSE